MRTCSSMTTPTRSPASGRASGMLTANGYAVAPLAFRICSRRRSGFIEPAPIMPSPPASETATASLLPAAHTIPACMIGYRMPKSPVALVSTGAGQTVAGIDTR